jgi:hypothetical protein
MLPMQDGHNQIGRPGMQNGDGQIGRNFGRVELKNTKIERKKDARTCPATAVRRGTASSGGGVVNGEVGESLLRSWRRRLRSRPPATREAVVGLSPQNNACDRCYCIER